MLQESPVLSARSDAHFVQRVVHPLRAAVQAGHLSAAEAATWMTQLDTTRAAWRRWSGHGGLERLMAFARSLSPRDLDRADDATTATWVDVQDRLAGAVARILAGQSVPCLRTTDDVDRYHRIQVRLRLQGRWRRGRREVALDAPVMDGGRSAAAQVQDRREGRSLAVGALWFLLDKPADTRSHWWTVVQHVLGGTAPRLPRSRRNDVVEARLGVLARVQVCRAQEVRVRRALGDDPAFGADLFGGGLPPGALLRAVRGLLQHLRPVLADALSEVDCSAEERDMLQRTLVQGRLIRTRMGAVTGDSARARRNRLAGLCAAWAGAVVARAG